MIYSMTGYGKAENSENGVNVVAEVQSLNGRFLDVRTKLPKGLYQYEAELRKIAQEYVTRGKVTVTVSLDKTSSRAEAMEVDFNLTDKYVGLSKEIAEKYGLDSVMDVSTLMTLPEVFIWKESNHENGELWDIAKKTVCDALDAHRTMRCDEGAAIGSDIEKRVINVAKLLDHISERAPGIAENNKKRLRKKLDSLIGKDTVDEIRFTMEVALYADRVDVTEECVRFKSHVEQFLKEITGESTSGKKLLFLLQEMNREANTIGSKIMDADCTQTVVSIKEELEKIREQAENTE